MLTLHKVDIRALPDTHPPVYVGRTAVNISNTNRYIAASSAGRSDSGLADRALAELVERIALLSAPSKSLHNGILIRTGQSVWVRPELVSPRLGQTDGSGTAAWPLVHGAESARQAVIDHARREVVERDLLSRVWLGELALKPLTRTRVQEILLGHRLEERQFLVEHDVAQVHVVLLSSEAFSACGTACSIDGGEESATEHARLEAARVLSSLLRLGNRAGAKQLPEGSTAWPRMIVARRRIVNTIARLVAASADRTLDGTEHPLWTDATWVTLGQAHPATTGYVVGRLVVPFSLNKNKLRFLGEDINDYPFP